MLRRGILGSLVAEEPDSTGCHDASIAGVDDRRFPELRTLSHVDGVCGGAKPAVAYRPQKAGVVLDPHDDLAPRRRRGARAEGARRLDHAGMNPTVYDAVGLAVPPVDVPLDDDLLAAHSHDFEPHGGRPAGVDLDGIQVLWRGVAHGPRITPSRPRTPERACGGRPRRPFPA